MQRRFITLADFIREWDSITSTEKFYDPQKYDLVPKKEYIDVKIKEIEEEIATLKRNMESVINHYDQKISSLREEKERLQNQKKK